MNKLSQSNSPYLKQHENNPVYWYPWCDNAFETAAAEDKPIFLSIGYSTCHWCHVMAHESFEDNDVASYLNEHFISIKVDREEHPDIDHLYMTVCQMATGHGGWPLTIVMTPEKRPFFAGTYFPKHSTQNGMGIFDVLSRVVDAWANKRDEVITSANHTLMSVIQNDLLPSGEPVLPIECCQKGVDQLAAQYDKDYGGFGQAPKFPTPHHFLFLLNYYRLTKDKDVLAMATHTLTQMRLGGIYDHVGFGFHRYSTDEQWRVPHFEKMLYDNALLLWSYADAYEVTQNELFKTTATELVTYLNRDMKADNGCFYAAEDADSEGEEGQFYVWTFDELQSILDDDEMDALSLDRGGNFLDESTGSKTGKNIILPQSVDALSVIDQYRDALLTRRNERVRVGRDNKILTDWNALAVIALCNAGQRCQVSEWIDQAEECFVSVQNQNDTDQKLRHCQECPGVLMDYASMGLAALSLFEATCQSRYLSLAEDRVCQMNRLFWDDKSNGYFMSEESSHLIVRQKEYHDGALPSGNAIAYLLLVRLFQITGKIIYEDRIKLLVSQFSTSIQQYPMAYTFWLYAETVNQMNVPVSCSVHSIK